LKLKLFTLITLDYFAELLISVIRTSL